MSGHIQCLGSKNFATKAMVASVLTEQRVELTNVPVIGDTSLTLEMLSSIGVGAEIGESTCSLDASHIGQPIVPLPDSGSNRIPILLLSVLLHRCGRATVPVVTGCDIGPRPVDFHLDVARRFGAVVESDENGYQAYAPEPLRGIRHALPYPSVGATETCLFLSVLAEGRSEFHNVAVEPEVMALVTMLNAMGAQIHLGANRSLMVDGVDQLDGVRFDVLGDRVEAASWACLAAASDGSIVVDGIEPAHLTNFFGHFNAVGGGVEVLARDRMRFYRRSKDLRSTIVETDVYPGFATDWQQPFATLLTQANGTSIIHETVYEKRFGYLETLNAIGALSETHSECLGDLACRFKGKGHAHSATITGSSRLESASTELEVPDLRAGLAYVLAAAIARGTIDLVGAELIERGYGNVAERVHDLTMEIAREEM